MKTLKLTTSYKLCIEQIKKLDTQIATLHKNNRIECKNYSVTTSTGSKHKVINIDNIEKALYFASVARSKIKVLDEIYHSIFHSIDNVVDGEVQNEVADLQPINARLEEEKNTYFSLRKRIECLVKINNLCRKNDLLVDFINVNFNIDEEERKLAVEELKHEIELTEF